MLPIVPVLQWSKFAPGRVFHTVVKQEQVLDFQHLESTGDFIQKIFLMKMPLRHNWCNSEGKKVIRCLNLISVPHLQ